MPAGAARGEGTACPTVWQAGGRTWRRSPDLATRPRPCAWTIDAAWNGDAQRRTYAWAFGSRHPGGARFVCCDGGTKFLADSIDNATLCQLASKAGGTSVTIP